MKNKKKDIKMHKSSISTIIVAYDDKGEFIINIRAINFSITRSMRFEKPTKKVFAGSIIFNYNNLINLKNGYEKSVEIPNFNVKIITFKNDKIGVMTIEGISIINPNSDVNINDNDEVQMIYIAKNITEWTEYSRLNIQT